MYADFCSELVISSWSCSVIEGIRFSSCGIFWVFFGSLPWTTDRDTTEKITNSGSVLGFLFANFAISHLRLMSSVQFADALIANKLIFVIHNKWLYIYAITHFLFCFFIFFNNLGFARWKFPYTHTYKNQLHRYNRNMVQPQTYNYSFTGICKLNWDMNKVHTCFWFFILCWCWYILDIWIHIHFVIWYLLLYIFFR